MSGEAVTAWMACSDCTRTHHGNRYVEMDIVPIREVILGDYRELVQVPSCREEGDTEERPLHPIALHDVQVIDLTDGHINLHQSECL